MMPSEKNTGKVILALDQAYEKFVWLEDESTDEAEICAYRCYNTNIYESKLYVEQMQKEIDRLEDTLRIMFNRCICFCGSRNCSECKQREECESKRSFWHGYYLLNGKRVKKDGEQQ